MKKAGYIIGVYVDKENLKEAQELILKNDDVINGICYVIQDYTIK
jgi:hypothetical protein